MKTGREKEKGEERGRKEEEKKRKQTKKKRKRRRERIKNREGMREVEKEKLYRPRRKVKLKTNTIVTTKINKRTKNKQTNKKRQ